jgi:hypothetical protein
MQQVIRKPNLPGTVTLTDSGVMPKADTGVRRPIEALHDFRGRYRRTMAASTPSADDFVYAVRTLVRCAAGGAFAAGQTHGVAHERPASPKSSRAHARMWMLRASLHYWAAGIPAALRRLAQTHFICTPP